MARQTSVANNAIEAKESLGDIKGGGGGGGGGDGRVNCPPFSGS